MIRFGCNLNFRGVQTEMAHEQGRDSPACYPKPSLENQSSASYSVVIQYMYMPAYF
jgi:hypothetical protein